MILFPFCMIVKNEEKSIGHCLRSIKPLVDEMIVVDTGSTDGTKDIAKVFGAKVYDFEWSDSFSDARNFSLSKASGKWILVLDADEAISSSDFDKLKKLVRTSTRTVAYSIVSRNYVIPMTLSGWVANDGAYIDEEAGTGWFPSLKVRLFPNDSRIRFEAPVHEFVEMSLKRAGITIKNCDIPVHHYGKLDREKILSKGEQYYNLGKAKLSDRGEADLPAMYELAVQATELERFEEALEYWEKLSVLKPDFPKVFYGLGSTYFRLGRFEDALSAIEKAIQVSPDYTDWRDAVILLSHAAVCAGKAENCIDYLEQLLRKDPGYPMALLLISIAYICAGKKEAGLKYLKKLAEINFNPLYHINDFSKSLISTKKPHPARLLLEAAVESNIASNETYILLAECHRTAQNEKLVESKEGLV